MHAAPLFSQLNLWDKKLNAGGLPMPINGLESSWLPASPGVLHRGNEVSRQENDCNHEADY
jgi:hypothetical protein